MGTLNESSLQKLSLVDKRLAEVIKLAVLRCKFDCVVSEGLRSKEKMMRNYGCGRTGAECVAKGISASYAKPKEVKITWLAHPLKSKHGDGDAVDIYPMIGDKLDDGKSVLGLQQYNALYHNVMFEAAATKVRIRYGGDWDQDGKLREKGESDSVHYELA